MCLYSSKQKNIWINLNPPCISKKRSVFHTLPCNRHKQEEEKNDKTNQNTHLDRRFFIQYKIWFSERNQVLEMALWCLDSKNDSKHSTTWKQAKLSTEKLFLWTRSDCGETGYMDIWIYTIYINMDTWQKRTHISMIHKKNLFTWAFFMRNP